jgi:2-iminobutanoate/2-iminopropanoate deaminase
MRKDIKTSLPSGLAPAAWGSTGGEMAYFAALPVRSDGSMDQGDIGSQTRHAMDRVKDIVEAAGGTMDDVVQVQLFIGAKEDVPGMNEAYRDYFTAPYPNRAVLIAQVAYPGVRIEVVGVAHIAQKAA